MQAIPTRAGLNNSIRFLKNIMGLWIIQECKRTWDKEGNVMSFAEIADGASKIEPCKFLINPDGGRILFAARYAR